MMVDGSQEDCTRRISLQALRCQPGRLAISSQRTHFIGDATDDVLFAILRFLPLVHTLFLTCASASLGVRLVGTPAEVTSGASSTVEHVLAAHAGSDVIGRVQQMIESSAVRASEARAHHLSASWPLLMVRALTGTFPKAVALRHAVELISSERCDSLQFCSSASLESAKCFLEAAFHSEAWSRGPGQEVAAVADLVFMAMLSCSTSGPTLILAITGAVAQAEASLDALFEEGRDNTAEYEAIARQRSAAKFILKRLETTISTDIADAVQHLELAMRSLDKSVESYMSEGHWHSGVYLFSSFGLNTR